MRISKLNITILISLLILGSGGCGGSSGPGFEIPKDPQAATQSDLESLFDRIAVELQTAQPGSSAALKLEMQSKTVGSELAGRAATIVRTRLSGASRIEGRIPLGTIDREFGGLDPIKRWDIDTHAGVKQELTQERETTKKAIALGEEKFEAIAEEDVLGRIQLLSLLSALSGTDSEGQARYAKKRDDILRDVSLEAEAAIQNEDYEKAQDLLSIVQEVNPGDDDARIKKCEVDGRVVLKRFSESLEIGRVERSMSMLMEFSETDCFEEIRDGLAESAAPMAEAFGMLGQEATESNEMKTAYQRYKDSRMISNLLIGKQGKLVGIDTFLKNVEQSYERAFEAGEYGVAWGCLNVITEFTRMTPKIRKRVRMTRDKLRRRAVRGITAYPFDDAKNSSAKVGDAVASKVVQHIFQTIPGDIRIVEREQLARILDECRRSSSCDDLDTADFIIQGTILDAKVETTEKSGSETRRVITGREAIPNPEHVRWAGLRDKEKNRTPEPPRTTTRKVTEDVTINVTSVRKVGIISVSYRVVEASTGRVLFTDSIQTKQTFQDEGRQGVQLGEFIQETDFVELPPDIEILSGAGGLSDIISEEIGVKLVNFFQNPEDKYAADSKRFVDEGDYISAAREAAYAILLREIKSKELGTLRDELKNYAMESPPL